MYSNENLKEKMNQQLQQLTQATQILGPYTDHTQLIDRGPYVERI